MSSISQFPSYNGSFRDRLLNVLRNNETSILFIITPNKKTVLDAFLQFHPEYDVDIKSIDNLHDEVTFIIGTQSVKYKFTWNERIDTDDDGKHRLVRYYLTNID